MKKIMPLFLIGMLILPAFGCGLNQIQGNIFESTPEEFVSLVNKTIQDEDLTFDIEGYTDTLSYYGKTIRTYSTNGGAKLELLMSDQDEQSADNPVENSQPIDNDTGDEVDEEESQAPETEEEIVYAIESVRLLIPDIKAYEETLESVKMLISRSSDALDEGTIETILKDYEKYRRLKLAKDIVISEVRYRYEWIDGSYSITVTMGENDSPVWPRKTGNAQMSYLVPEDWQISVDSEKFGVMYETPDKLLVSIHHAEVNTNLASLKLNIDLNLDDSRSIYQYFNKFFSETLASEASAGNSLIEKNVEEAYFKNDECLNVVYSTTATANGEETVRSTKTLFFFHDKHEYVISIIKTGQLTEKDIDIFDNLLESIKFN